MEQYLIQAAKYMIPEGSESNTIPELHTHNLDGSTEFDSYSKLYQKFGGNVVLRLLSKECNTLHKVEGCQYILQGSDTAIIEISRNGQFVAILSNTCDQH